MCQTASLDIISRTLRCDFVPSHLKQFSHAMMATLTHLLPMLHFYTPKIH